MISPASRLCPLLLLVMLGPTALRAQCPKTPADLFDLKGIHAMTLKDLGWQQISRRTLPSGSVFLQGRWSGGPFKTFDAQGRPRTIGLSEHASLLLPKGYPRVPALGKGVVAADHVATSSRQVRWDEVASGLRIPVLSHGEYAVDWQSLGYKSRGELIGMSFKLMVKLNPTNPVDLTTGNFAWALARTQLMAIQLERRLLEAAGGRLDAVALWGGSKEGFSTWLASAVEGKIAVAAPANYQQEDFRGTLRLMVTDWNGLGKGGGRLAVPELLDYGYWLDTTKAGACALALFSVQAFQRYLKPQMFLIAGDVSLPGMHDASYFPLGCETPFLDGFTTKPWTYDRLPDHHRRESATVRRKRRMGLLADTLIRGPSTVLPELPRVLGNKVTTDDAARTFSVRATVATRAASARLWWSWSKDRSWNERGQAAWVAAAMTRNAPGIWTSPVIQAPKGMQVGWYVEAENRVQLGRWKLPRRSCSPVRFLWEHPKLSPDFDRLRATRGGTIVFGIDATHIHAGEGYLLLGSASGTTPGLGLGSWRLPLNPDGHFFLLLGHPNTLIRSSLGNLDGAGRATATMSLPPLPGVLRGVTIDHAYVLFGSQPPQLTGVSNAAPMKLVD